MRSTSGISRAHGLLDDSMYNIRIDAVNYALRNDDGISTKDYDKADVILIGVSRTGKPRPASISAYSSASTPQTTHSPKKTSTSNTRRSPASCNLTVINSSGSPSTPNDCKNPRRAYARQPLFLFCPMSTGAGHGRVPFRLKEHPIPQHNEHVGGGNRRDDRAQVEAPATGAMNIRKP